MTGHSEAAAAVVRALKAKTEAGEDVARLLHAAEASGSVRFEHAELRRRLERYRDALADLQAASDRLNAELDGGGS